MSTYYYTSETESVVRAYDEEEPRPLRYFSFFLALSQVFGFLMLFLTGKLPSRFNLYVQSHSLGYWNGNYNGDYQWGEKDSAGNVLTGNWHYHATFMTYGLVFLQGEGT